MGDRPAPAFPPLIWLVQVDASDLEGPGGARGGALARLTYQYLRGAYHLMLSLLADPPAALDAVICIRSILIYIYLCHMVPWFY